MSKESKILIAVLVGVVGIMIGLFVVSNSGSEGPGAVGDKTKIIRDNSHKIGSGPVQLVEFGDFQCPACGAAYPNVERLLKDYDGKITYYFRNFPLVNIHQNANAGSNAAEAAGDQGKFWEMYRKLFEGQKVWNNKTDPTDIFVGYAGEIGLDVNKFKADLTEKKFQNLIDQDVADANALGVNSTPTFYFNGKKFTGTSTYESLKAEADALLAGAATASATPTPSPAPAP
jgi:protein-disulfide isomerase